VVVATWHQEHWTIRQYFGQMVMEVRLSIKAIQEPLGPHPADVPIHGWFLAVAPVYPSQQQQ